MRRHEKEQLLPAIIKVLLVILKAAEMTVVTDNAENEQKAVNTEQIKVLQEEVMSPIITT